MTARYISDAVAVAGFLKSCNIPTGWQAAQLADLPGCPLPAHKVVTALSRAAEFGLVARERAYPGGPWLYRAVDTPRPVETEPPRRTLEDVRPLIGGLATVALQRAGFHTVAEVAEATDERLLACPKIGVVSLRRIRRHIPAVSGVDLQAVS